VFLADLGQREAKEARKLEAEAGKLQCFTVNELAKLGARKLQP
jgi:hypothetical protein